MHTCNSRRTRRRSKSSMSCARVEFKVDRFRRPLRGGGERCALCDRARRLEGCGGPRGSPEPLSLRRRDDAFRARARRRALGQSGRRQGGHRQACGAARQAQGQPTTPIGRKSSTSSTRSPPPGCSRPRATTRPRWRRWRRGRCRGQDRETPGDARPAGARARTLRRDAARARHGEAKRSPPSKPCSRRSQTGSRPMWARRARPRNPSNPTRRSNISPRSRR